MDFNFERVTPEHIEDMLYQIQIYGNRKLAKTFSNLPFELQQKITFVLKMRSRRSKENIDAFLVREVIDDARKGKFIDYGII